MYIVYLCVLYKYVCLYLYIYLHIHKYTHPHIQYIFNNVHLYVSVYMCVKVLVCWRDLNWNFLFSTLQNSKTYYFAISIDRDPKGLFTKQGLASSPVFTNEVLHPQWEPYKGIFPNYYSWGFWLNINLHTQKLEGEKFQRK